jgi:DNA-binding GntR family transcriptional regulator
MSASDLAYHTIKKKILLQEFPPGSQLKEIDLCKITGLTRTPIREAMIRLESEKLLTSYPNKGSFVKQMSKEEIEDLFEVRETLEVKCLSLAMKKSSRIELLKIEKALTDRKEIFNSENEAKYFLPKIDFHYELIKLSKNTILIDIWKGLHTRLQLFRVKSAMTNRRFLNSIDEHQNILYNICEHNLLKAEKLLKSHIKTVKENLYTSMDFNLDLLNDFI